jgi:hypothetical protein
MTRNHEAHVAEAHVAQDLVQSAVVSVPEVPEVPVVKFVVMA